MATAEFSGTAPDYPAGGSGPADGASSDFRVATGDVASAGNAIPLHFEAVLRRIEKRGRYGEAEDDPRFLRSQSRKPGGRRQDEIEVVGIRRNAADGNSARTL
jgi:hypothetical protein